eukprot:9497940-Pyramimonas_sp.AAC.1
MDVFCSVALAASSWTQVDLYDTHGRQARASVAHAYFPQTMAHSLATSWSSTSFWPRSLCWPWWSSSSHATIAQGCPEAPEVGCQQDAHPQRHTCRRTRLLCPCLLATCLDLLVHPPSPFLQLSPPALLLPPPLLLLLLLRHLLIVQIRFRRPSRPRHRRPAAPEVGCSAGSCTLQ